MRENEELAVDRTEGGATDVQSRLAELEQLTADQADALEAQSRLIETLRSDMRTSLDVIRELGEALRDHVEAHIADLATTDEFVHALRDVQGPHTH